MTNKTITPPINRGISLISMAIVLGIVLIAAPIGMERYSNYLEEQTWVVTATHLSTVNQAARLYVKDNYDTILNQVKGGGNITVTGQTLRDRGYLPAGFSLTNNNAQNYILAITSNRTQNDKLVAFVLTAGGENITFKAQRYIAQNTVGLGGYIYPANIANGAGGGWQINLSSLGLSGQAGHLATYLTSDDLGGGAEESDRLYRFAVNGRPDLNRMHTNIDMNSNNINNAKSINGETGNFSSTVTTESDIKSKNGWLITGSGKGWLNEAHGGGLYMDDNNWIKSVNGKGISTSGQLKGGSVRSDGRLSGGEYLQLDGVVTEGATCSPNRLIAFNAAGNVLSCQNGRWTMINGSTGNYASLGRYVSTYSGVNSSSKNIIIYASGGVSTVDRHVDGGDNCRNTWSLAAYVNSSYVTGAESANSNWGKSGAINFVVPPGASYQVTSNPLPSYGCSPGSFNLMAYR